MVVSGFQRRYCLFGKFVGLLRAAVRRRAQSAHQPFAISSGESGSVMEPDKYPTHGK